MCEFCNFPPKSRPLYANRLLCSKHHASANRATLRHRMTCRTAMNFLMTFVVGQSFLSMMCVMKWGIFLFFAGMVCLMSAFVLIVLPETQGIPLVCPTQAHFDFCSQEGV